MISKSNVKTSLPLDIKPYIDYDKVNKIFYHNLYFEEHKFVLKIPLEPLLNTGSFKTGEGFLEKMNEEQENLRLEQFDLSKFVYLLSYD